MFQSCVLKHKAFCMDTYLTTTTACPELLVQFAHNSYMTTLLHEQILTCMSKLLQRILVNHSCCLLPTPYTLTVAQKCMSRAFQQALIHLERSSRRRGRDNPRVHMTQVTRGALIKGGRSHDLRLPLKKRKLQTVHFASTFFL